MKPDAKTEAEGLLAYERVCAFEQLQRRQVPLIYAGFVQVLLMCGVGAAVTHHADVGMGFLMCAIAFGIFAWTNWKYQGVRYRENQQLLARLEREYGDDLPWIQVEKHFDALEKLERELDDQRQDGSKPAAK